MLSFQFLLQIRKKLVYRIVVCDSNGFLLGVN